MSLFDIYGLDEAEGKTADKTAAAPGEPSGVKTGTVVSVTSDGIFVDMAGKSQGFLPAEELEEGEVLTPGQTIKVTILRYDNHDGLLILLRKTAEQQLLASNLQAGDRVELACYREK